MTLVRRGLAMACVLAAVSGAARGAPAAGDSPATQSPPPRAADDFAKQPTWSAPSADIVRVQTFVYLADKGVDESIVKQAEELWPDAQTGAAPISGSDLLERVVKTIALAEPQAADQLKLCAKPRPVGPAPKATWLADEKLPPLVRNNFKLWWARWAAQEQMYDLSLEQIGGLEPTDVVDPASLLFYQSVDRHWLLKKDDGLKTISRLLERKAELPRRYSQLAELMQADLQGLKEDSLDHIARRMRDAERLLDQAHAGKKVRGVEDGIIDSLDKLIKQKEDQQQQAMASAAGSKMGPGGKQSSAPAPDSARLQGKGPGNIDSKNLGHQAGWGDLPPKERQEVLQAIGKEFPSHFRDVIEQYFKKAAESNEP